MVRSKDCSQGWETLHITAHDFKIAGLIYLQDKQNQNLLKHILKTN